MERHNNYILSNEVSNYIKNIKDELFNVYGKKYYTGTFISNKNAELMNQIIVAISDSLNCSIVIYKNGTYKLVESSYSWEYEQDKEWLTTIKLDNPNLF